MITTPRNHTLRTLTAVALGAAAFAASLMPARAAADKLVNLLGQNDLKTPAGWGNPVRIPEDTGEFTVENNALTMNRKRPGGDFKVYRVVDGLEPNTDYSLRFEIRVDGPGAARIGVLQKTEGADWTWNTPLREFTAAEAWQTAEIRFRTPPQKMSFCLQLYPPAEVGAKLSLGPLSLFAAAALQQAAGDENVYPCCKFEQAPKLDGVLDDPAWRLTPEVSGFCRLQAATASDDGLQVLPGDVQVEEQREFVTTAITYFQAGYTQDTLFIATRCYQPNADKLSATKENSPDLWQNDCIEIHIAPGAGKPKVQFILNPLGAHWPDGWDVAATRRQDSWLAEAAIPFARFGVTPKPGDTWRVNISRHSTTPKDDLTTWAPRVVNFHDVDHYRAFQFKGEAPTQDAKTLAEIGLNQAFNARAQAAAQKTDATDKADKIKTYFEIHTRNVNAALLVNGKRVSLSGKTWLTSYAGRKERTLRAALDIDEGENVVGIVAKADGADPGIRIQVGRATTDPLWKCAATADWAWLKPGYDDTAWTPVPVATSKDDFFFWTGDATDLCFRQALRGVEKASQDVKYSVTDWKRNDLGRHRAILHVSESVQQYGRISYARFASYGTEAKQRYEAVWAHIPWRRRDQNPEAKGIRIIDAKTGQPVKNVIVLNVKQEYGDIIFQAPTIPGDYEVYYLPYVPLSSSPWFWGLTDPYLPAYQEPEPNWVNRVAWSLGDEPAIMRGELGDITRGNWQLLPPAEVVEIQAKTEFDRFDPMEVIATREEVGALLDQTQDREYLLFPEDRKYPIRMFETLPLAWIKRGPAPEFKGDAQPGEYYCLQLGVFASRAPISDLSLTFSDLTCDGKPAIPAAEWTCLNLGGTDWLGKAFTQPFPLAQGKVRALWLGVQLPDTAQGTYTSTVTVQPKGLQPQTVKIAVNVAGAVIANHGDDEPWRHSRLRWLNSTLGLDDDWLVPPYTPLKAEANRIECLARAVEFGPLGMPQQVTSRGHAILATPMRFVATRDGKPVEWTPAGNPETQLQKAGKIVRQYAATAPGLTLSNTVTMEFDGCVQFDIAVTATADTALADVGLDVPFSRKIATYMAGGDAPGGYRPPSHQWTFNAWARSYTNIWVGDVNAGMQLRATEGRGTLAEQGDAALVTTRVDTAPLKAGQARHFSFRLLITPFKPITNVHWTTRVGNALDPKAPGHPTIEHIHHANAANPWINYPFLTPEKLVDLQKQILGNGGLGVQLYYTVRELTNRCVEIWALRSLGGEILVGPERCFQAGANPTREDGHPWLREHLGDGFCKAWRTGTAVPNEIDAAVAMRYLSRWHNYYIEGMDWLQQNKCFYSLYLDGIGYDREIMKRVARVMSKYNPAYRMEHHQCTDAKGSSVANADLEHLPFVTQLWYGECFNYNRSPDYWLVDVSGIPFGVTGEMLEDTGTGNLWRGMLYGLAGRNVPNCASAWTLWDEFGIQDAEWLGYWDPKCPARTDCKDVLVTVYRKPGKALIAVATWSLKDENVKLTIDWAALGLDPATVKLHAPAIPKMQDARTVKPDEPLPVKVAGGWFLVAETP
ncbi:MAG: hypothetical protein A3K19_06685 [Lentisphaerae bacterium RIFOXYB12_FULL_65_16]|nr:MAG: hypothetical protein A3K18_07815 [Lentisphaerae bacterium RIFOXYA12_64_32]OGV93125.1 MAG: hypothetical protein A3K19_06685 [Lentisphaerae bacterium RIFOXYB12_FULL_65_16]